jgi:hypothetical protein
VYAVSLEPDRPGSLDRQDYFRHPVSQADVPDYFDIIKNPMCWTVIDSGLDLHEYWDLQSFKVCLPDCRHSDPTSYVVIFLQNDVQLVLDNAMLYNKSGTSFYKTAVRIQTAMRPIMEELAELSRCPAPLHIPNGDTPQSSNGADELQVGDLEPTLDVLNLLVSLDTIQDELDLLVEHDPLASLLNFEMPQFKPPPIPTQILDAKQAKAETKNVKRERKTKGVANTDALDSAPGFRAPRTRRAIAEAAQIEAEAIRASKKGIKLKRPTMIPPGQLNVPPMVNDVNNHQSFKMFDAGWILPPYQKRGGRQPIDRSVLPPPRKRVKTGLYPLHDRLFPNKIWVSPEFQTSTRNVEVQVTTSNNVERPTQLEKLTQASSVNHSPLSSESKPLLETFDPKISSIVESADGTIIIETLDTPSIRRAKRKAQAFAASAIPSTSTKPLQSWKTNADVEMESELSSLTGVGSEVHDEPDTSHETMPLDEDSQPTTVGAVQLPLEGGTLGQGPFMAFTLNVLTISSMVFSSMGESE